MWGQTILLKWLSVIISSKLIYIIHLNICKYSWLKKHNNSGKYLINACYMNQYMGEYVYSSLQKWTNHIKVSRKQMKVQNLSYMHRIFIFSLGHISSMFSLCVGYIINLKTSFRTIWQVSSTHLSVLDTFSWLQCQCKVGQISSIGNFYSATLPQHLITPYLFANFIQYKIEPRSSCGQT